MGFDPRVIKKLENLEDSEALLELGLSKQIRILEERIEGMPDSTGKRKAMHKIAKLHGRLAKEARKAEKIALRAERRLKGYR